MLPKEIVIIITKYIRECIEKKINISESEMFEIGALLGCQYVKGLGWSWQSVDWNNNLDDGAIGVLNSNKALFNNPIGWVCQTMERAESVTFLLSYNMIESGKYPKLEPNSATPFY